MERKLASVQRVLALEPIPGADQIEKATIQGWEVVVKKGDFVVGELCLYCEIDSILPEKPEFEFLRDRKFHIKTIKLRKQVSQGIAFRRDGLPSFALEDSWVEGTDVTERMGVKKHDPQADAEKRLVEQLDGIEFFKRFAWYRRLTLRRRGRLPFPAFLPITDEPRIQNIRGVCTDNVGFPFYVTEKLDGQSGTFFMITDKSLLGRVKAALGLGDGRLFGVCSRNFQLLRPDGQSYWKIAELLNMRQKLEQLYNNFGPICAQGEIVGPVIQGNKLGFPALDFFVFNMFKISGANKKFSGQKLSFWCDAVGLKTVPILDSGFKLLGSVPEMVEYSRGKSVLNPGILREGIVVRNDEGISFKVINPDFLLKYSEEQ